jgi:hypothetical protein
MSTRAVPGPFGYGLDRAEGLPGWTAVSVGLKPDTGQVDDLPLLGQPREGRWTKRRSSAVARHASGPAVSTAGASWLEWRSRARRQP